MFPCRSTWPEETWAQFQGVLAPDLTGSPNHAVFAPKIDQTLMAKLLYASYNDYGGQMGFHWAYVKDFSLLDYRVKMYDSNCKKWRRVSDRAWLLRVGDRNNKILMPEKWISLAEGITNYFRRKRFHGYPLEFPADLDTES